MRSIEVIGSGSDKVTESAHVVTFNNGQKILIDAGIYQEGSGQNYDERNRHLNGHHKYDGVVLTHAHADHVLKLPFLEKIEDQDNTNTPIFATPATYDLTELNLRSSERLSPPGFYPKGSVDSVLKRITPDHRIDYDKPFKIGEITVTLNNAEHILGSSSPIMHENNGDTIVFSGDLGNDSPYRIIEPAKKTINQADVVVMESTYGDKNHPNEDPVEILKEGIERAKIGKGAFLISGFAIERIPQIVNLLREYRQRLKLDGIPVYLDAKMAVLGLKIYKKYPHLLKEELRQPKLDPFHFPELIITYNADESDKIAKRSGAKIIIAGPGMMTGGRISKHALNYLPYPNSTIMLTGYTAAGSPSRALADGQKEVEFDGQPITVRGKVLKTSAFSSHADQRQLLDWLKNININPSGKRIRKVILVHGAKEPRKVLAQKIVEDLKIVDVVLPENGEVIDLYNNM